MRSRPLILMLVPGLVVGIALLGANPASGDHRLAPAAHQLDAAAAAFVNTLIGEAHHGGEGHEG